MRVVCVCGESEREERDREGGLLVRVLPPCLVTVRFSGVAWGSVLLLSSRG